MESFLLKSYLISPSKLLKWKHVFYIDFNVTLSFDKSFLNKTKGKSFLFYKTFEMIQCTKVTKIRTLKICHMFLNCKSGICILRKTFYFTYLFKLPTWFLVWNTDTSKIFKEYSLFMSLNFRMFYLPVRWWLPC